LRRATRREENCGFRYRLPRGVRGCIGPFVEVPAVIGQVRPAVRFSKRYFNALPPEVEASHVWRLAKGAAMLHRGIGVPE